jgi:low temperature requirement protein LtrA
MVAGIVLFAFGLKTTLPDVTRELPAVPAFGLVGGIALYLLAHVAVRLRMGGGIGHGRPTASVVLLALIPVPRVMPAIAALGMVAGVSAALIAYEALRYREARTLIRRNRGEFSVEEARSHAVRTSAMRPRTRCSRSRR